MCENCKNPSRMYQIFLASEWANGRVEYHKCPHCLERCALPIRYKEEVKFDFVFLGDDKEYELFKESPLCPRMSDQSFLDLNSLRNFNKEIRYLNSSVHVVQKDLKTSINLNKIKKDKTLP